MREGKWMERKYVARNGVVERTRFLVGRSAKPRSKKEGRTDERKQEGNRNSATHRLGRLLNHNFSQGDLFLTLEYTTAERTALRKKALQQLPARHTGEDTRNRVMELAREDAMLFVRRLRRIWGKAGQELKAIVVTSDMDNEGKKKAAIHHHLVISGELAVIQEKTLTIGGRSPEELWGHGITGWECLRSGSYSPLAVYLMKQVRDIPQWRKYTTTRNLEKIVPEEYEVGPGTDPTEEIRIPAGARMEERLHFGESALCQYVRYIPPEPKAKRGGHKGGK